MKLIVSKIIASVNEIAIDLNASNWRRIKAEIELASGAVRAGFRK